MSPTSYQAAPPRINTLTERPLLRGQAYRLLTAGVTVVRALQTEAREYRNRGPWRQPA